MNDSVTPALSQWGTPVEWWVDAQYPDPKTTSLTQWAWEFVRRNPDLRQFWRDSVLPYFDMAVGAIDEDAYWQAQVLKRQAWIESRPPAGSCFDIVSLAGQMEKRFGVWGDPRRSDRHSGFTVPGRKHYRPLPRSVVEKMETDPKFRQTLSTRYPGDLLRLTGNEVVIVFDADRPVEPQLEEAKTLLQAYQPADVKDFRLRINLYRSYLQVLDADDAGVLAGGIASTLFSEPNDYETGYRKSHLIRHYLEAAQKLRDRGYRYLAALDFKT